MGSHELCFSAPVIRKSQGGKVFIRSENKGHHHDHACSRAGLFASQMDAPDSCDQFFTVNIRRGDIGSDVCARQQQDHLGPGRLPLAGGHRAVRGAVVVPVGRLAGKQQSRVALPADRRRQLRRTSASGVGARRMVAVDAATEAIALPSRDYDGAEMWKLTPTSDDS